jgi:hypothetical protein
MGTARIYFLKKGIFYLKLNLYLIESLNGPHQRIKVADPGVNIFSRLDMGSSIRPWVSSKFQSRTKFKLDKAKGSTYGLDQLLNDMKSGRRRCNKQKK